MKTGTILRTNKNKDNPFVMIDKGVFEDSRISWAAKGLMGYLLSKPDGWIVRVGDLMNNGTAKRTALRHILRELERCGYMQRVRTRSEAGRIEWVTEVYESPVPVSSEQAQKVNPTVAATASASQARTRATIN